MQYLKKGAKIFLKVLLLLIVVSIVLHAGFFLYSPL